MNRQISRFSTVDADISDRLAKLAGYVPAQDERVEATVRGILADVRGRGDAALLEYTRKFDRSDAASTADLEIESADLDHALDSLPREQSEALRDAANRVRRFHERQLVSSWEYS